MSGALARNGGFSRGIKQLAEGKIVGPILHAELMKPTFKGFTVKVDKWTERPFDGRFHPSTHSDWPARKLALYLTHPQDIEEEPPTLEKVIAVTQGHFWHKFGGKILQRNGVVTALEIESEDLKHNRYGHMDGKLFNGEGFEFKTINNEWLVKKIKDLETLREFKPGYFSQAQDYMDMQGLDGMRFLMMAMFYPYPMVEFVIPRDEAFLREQRAKYLEALESAAEGGLPEPCCLPRSKEAKTCELRTACTVGRAALKLAPR